mgnify:CR=1 FL=1
MVYQLPQKEGAALATSFGTMVGTLGTVLFYGTATINLAWQHVGWKAVEKGDYHKLYLVDMVLPWISHILCSFIPALIMCKLGADVVELIKTTLPMDGLAMKLIYSWIIITMCRNCNLIKTNCYKSSRFHSIFLWIYSCCFNGNQFSCSNSDRWYVCFN